MPHAIFLLNIWRENRPFSFLQCITNTFKLILESLSPEGTSGYCITHLLKGGTARPCCSGSWLARFWICPRMEMPSGQPHSKKRFFIDWNGISSISLCAHCLLFCYWWRGAEKTLVLSWLLPPDRYSYTLIRSSLSLLFLKLNNASSPRVSSSATPVS